MFQKLFRKNTVSVGDANSQKDYLEYFKSIEQTLSKLESSLHTSDSPEEIAVMAMQTPVNSTEQIGAAFWKLIWIWDCGLPTGGTMSARRIKRWTCWRNLALQQICTAG